MDVALQPVCHRVTDTANRRRRIRQLPGLDVDAGALPGDENFGVRVFDAAVCAAARRAVVEGNGDAIAAGGTGFCGAGDRAGKPKTGAWFVAAFSNSDDPGAPATL